DGSRKRAHRCRAVRVPRRAAGHPGRRGHPSRRPRPVRQPPRPAATRTHGGRRRSSHQRGETRAAGGVLMATEIVEIEGHIIDSLILAKVMDVILAAGADYRVLDVDIGKTNTDTSRARLEVRADDEDSLASLLVELQVHGANRIVTTDAELVTADRDGVLPAGFYSTTNLPTSVRVDGRWLDIENCEMDCGVVVLASGRVRTVPMHRIRVGDRVVVGSEGVRVSAPEKPRGASPFEFMASEV